MKRIILIVGIFIGLLLLALLASPFWLGLQTQSSFNESVQTLAARGGALVKNAVFSRGWLASEAENEFILPGGAQLAISATHHIEHGPLPLSNLAGGNLTPVLARIESKLVLRAGKDAPAELASFLGTLPPITLTTTLDLSGNGSSIIKIAGGQRKQDGDTIKWTAANGGIQFDKDLKEIKTNLVLPSISYQSGAGNLQIKNISVGSNAYEGTAGYMFGHTSFGVEQISMKPFVDISDINMGALIQPKGRFATIKLNYGMKKLVLAKDVYGPGKINIRIRHLDAATLKRFEDELNKIYGRSLPREQMQMMVTGKLMEYVGKLTRDNPEIEVTRLSFVAPGGELQGNARFVVEGKEQDLSANPMLILTAIKGRAEISMPESLAKAIVMPQIQRDLAQLQQEGRLNHEETSRLTPEMIDQIANEAYPRYLRDSGFGRWFVRDGGGYKFTLSVSRGQIVVNGVPLSGSRR
jgi:uncharacterized protein YdgA (DUF945 family)